MLTTSSQSPAETAGECEQEKPKAPPFALVFLLLLVSLTSSPYLEFSLQALTCFASGARYAR